ncbi:release factor glutamine methyltransferase [Thermoactinomyces sp. DSM 45891]|uniref:peptide chain release factor N(5)-glutamine methyltransferase n=1 Tax=Thermoactinomyces sp. DSM 45891 TaxID=1761907 RepID=UPI00091DF0F8|nr:peptide chain release factor N(5)-glutamine methyltransferase [Thermoactinomyces sp. DSM 45891]SFX62883.1 release factor glutamine methyltransferase [Thermoactinomyces sp. DSM 45891]
MHTGQTIREAFAGASSFLRDRGSDSPEFEAELLLRRLLGLNRTQLFMKMADAFPADVTLEWDKWLARRAEGEPIQYIVGDQEFYGRVYEVNSSVLIPRPETELLVEGVLQEGKSLFGDEEVWIAEVGTGSGCISISLVLEAPNWTVTTVDLSSEALGVARRNAASYDVLERVEFMQGNLVEPLISKKDRFQIFVSNPPYISSDEMLGLEKQVRSFEPHLALHGGSDGLDPYRLLCGDLCSWPNLRLVAFEIGASQGSEVERLVQSIPGMSKTEIRQDYAGLDRMVFGWRHV